jgi:predicted Zn-dependent protease
MAVLVAAAGVAAQPEWPDASQELLHSARLWESRQRGDLAQLALKKLVASRPDSPVALEQLGELDLRIRDFTDAAQVAGELEQRFAGTPAARGFAVEYRIATRERVQLAAIHRLIAIHRTGEVRAALDRLFPEGAPADALGIEYYELLACTPTGWALASTGLERLAALHPDDPRYQFALARHFLERPQDAAAASQILRRLARRDDVLRSEVDPLLAIAQRERGRPALPPVSKEAAAAAARWFERSRMSSADGLARRAAAESDAAAAFRRGQFESEILVSQALEAAGAAAEARELLAAAAAFDPRSDWLFETDMRWLIGHGRSAEALRLLTGRPVRSPWTVARRDALLAAAFDAKANAEAADQPDDAIRDLEAAIRLAPRDPWMRFRLANLYTARRASDRGRAVMSDGAVLEPNDPVMAYAQALYLMNLDDFARAIDVIDRIEFDKRSADMHDLDDRARVGLARESARRLKRSNDTDGARAALLAVEPIAHRRFDLATDLAYSWIEIGFADHGIALLEPYTRAAGSADLHVQLTWARVLASAGDTLRLGAALERLRTSNALSADERVDVAAMQRALDLRVVRSLVHDGRYAEAAVRLDALLALDPHDRALRAARADVYLATGQPRRARDLYAALAAEQPDDLRTRLDYIRALTESGDLRLARTQLRGIEDKVPSADDELQINLARRQLDLDEARAALRSLQPLLAVAAPRQDVLMLAARAALHERDFAAARDYFARAELAAGDEGAAAGRGRDDIDARLQSVMTAGLVVRHQPGTAGMSQLDLVTIPTLWTLPLDYERRVTARADAVTVDAGSSGANSSMAALLGTVQAAGATGAQRYSNGEQSGVSLGAGYRTDSLSADVGTTPLGFLLTNVVGGVEWTPRWNSTDVTLGLARRAVTNSELSFAGLRDPITGTPWGAVVETGPYAGLALYRERYSIAGSIQADDLTGTHVENNRFLGAHAAADWKFISRPTSSLATGVTLDYWNYQRNLSNYTFGNGGYYSPQSYVSLAVPLEINGIAARWNYRVRIAPSYTLRDTNATAFYPDDVALQSAALHAPLPTGYGAPYFAADRSNSLGIYALAAGEREITRGVVVGGMLEIDRTDYYHPTTLSIYVRHAFGSSKTRAMYPAQPIRPYSP